MFNTKLEVDRHVENCLKKINSDLERNLRCFAFAKLYFKVGDYEQSHRYVLNYLHVKPTSADGHNLLGKVLEKLNKKEAALEAYRASLDLDPKQNNLVIKVCELFSSNDVNLDHSGARYFCEKAQSFDPYNPIIFHLKERLVASESKDPNDVSTLLLKELETRPLDTDIRIRLLRHLLQNNKIKEAYIHALEIEQKHSAIFINNLHWYETLTEVLFAYQHENSLNNSLTWEFWMLLVGVLDKLVSLSLDERTISIKNNVECVSAVFNFDQNFKIAAENVKACPDKQFIQEFLNHYTGQLCLHITTLLFKYARKDLIKYKEVSQLNLPLLFAAYNFTPADLQSMWFEHSTELRRSRVQRWHREAAYRCSQVGHILMSISKDRKTVIIEKASQNSTGLWREHTFKRLFITRDQQSKMKTSYFINSNHLVDITLRLPESTELIKYDGTAQLVYPDSLHNYIWIGLNQNLAQFHCTVFQGLQYSIKNLNHCAAETLNVLDIEAFAYCAIICANSQIEENRHTIYYNPEKPNLLPAAVTEELGTINQEKWLKCAYKMYKNHHGNQLGDIRVTLIKGIECIRCVGNHGLDVKLLVALAKTFAERASALTKHSEVEYNDARAELYWKTALPLLEKLKKNQAISFATNRLFEYKSKEMSQSEILQSISDGKLFIACQLMKKKEHEKALALLEVLKDPYASFYQAQIYKLMADKETNQNKENVTSEMRSQHIILLTKARDCLYLTLDRLRDPNVDRKHPLNEKLGTEIEKIERLLSRIDPDICVNRNECDGMSDENVSSIESENYINSTYHNNYTNGNFASRQETSGLHSTPYRYDHSRREARPSPERLDAQLRQLAAAKDSAINNILEQNKIMVESHKLLVDEVRSFREAVNGLMTSVNDLKQIKHTVDDIKGIKKSVEELKTAVDDLQNFRNVTDTVYEMRKELSELKKDAHKIKSNQLSDEDLYVLDEEYAAEYGNINSNVPSLTPSIYPNMGRLPPAANSLAYGTPLYHGLYPMYHYPGLGLPQAGALPFGHESQLSDFRAMSSLSQGLNQPGLTPSAYQQPTAPVPPQLSHLGQSGLVNTSLPQNTFVASLSQLQQQQQQPQISNFLKEAGASTQSTFASTVSITSFSTATNTTNANRVMPVNVVITSSEPLPTTKSVTTPQVLSVTIPPQHLKGNHNKVHNYQIPLPTTSATVTSAPSVLNQSPMPVSTQSLLSNIAPPVYSAIGDKSPNKNVSLGFQIEKSMNQSLNKSNADIDILNKTGASTTSQDEHDPCPDFKPVIPLPDEVPVNTGEENEDVLFCERAKLFRYTNKEWKERGIGDLKILRNPDSEKIRLIMRRDQVHKICANHYITSDMSIMPMNKNEKAYIWAANDYAEGEVVLEKFCVQFKNPDIAKKFKQEFENAKVAKPSKNETQNKIVPQASTPQPVTKFGGFKFTSEPTFLPKDGERTPPVEIINDSPKTSPFALFSFTKDNKEKSAATISDNGSKTNLFPSFSFASTEKNVAAPFTSSPKPLGFTFSSSGDKPFASLSLNQNEKNSDNKTKPFSPFSSDENKPGLVKPSPISISFNKSMSDTTFTPVQKQDISSSVKTTTTIELNETTSEDFVPTAEFKPVIPLPDLVDVKTGEENAEVLFESKAKLLRYQSTTKEWKERGIGQMKILKESTIRLLMRREQVHKVCCNHQLLKNMEFARMKSTANAVTWCAKDFSEAVFTNECFAIRFKNEELTLKFLDTLEKAKQSLDENNVVKSETRGDKKIKPIESEPIKATSAWADKFKSTWNCKTCYVDNEQKVNYCVACDSPKNDNIPKKQSDAQFCFGVAQKSQTPTAFSFGGGAITTQSSDAKDKSQGFGDMFKPKKDSWECTSCYTRNDADKVTCASCETPKDGTQAKTTSALFKSEPKGIDLSTGGLKFNFGMPAAAPVTQSKDDEKPTSTTTPSANPGFGDAFKPKVGSWECKECYSRNEGDYCLACECPKDDTIPVKENKANKGVDLSTGGLKFSFGIPAGSTGNTFDSQAKNENKGFSFSLPTSTETTEKKEETVFGSPHKAGFAFTPRSPRRQSGGHVSEYDSENSYYEEEEDNIYFKPVIPLPDKVEVTTGEEEEQVLYCHRAKLYRHVSGEWKERGIGDLKILLKKDTNKLRVLMRREQVLKICLNHALTSDIQYSPKDEKTWLFSAPDYSEGEIEYNNFCLRFKNTEIAESFKKAVDSALRGETDSVVSTDNDDDVEIVSETKVTPEEEEEAKLLKLPLKFMSYRQLPDCTCKQCAEEDELLKSLFTTEPKSAGSENTFSYGTPNTSHCSTFSNSSSIFGTPTNTTFSNNKSIFGTPSNVTKSFSFLNTNEKEPDTLKKLLTLTASVPDSTNKPIFGTPASDNGNKSKSLFGTAAPDTTSIFGTSASESNNSNKSIFGSSASESNNTNKSIFETSASESNNTNKSIFGSSASESSNTNKSVFGKSIFGQTTPSSPSSQSVNKSIFEMSTPSTVFGAKSTSHIFGGGTQTPNNTPTTPIFGATLFSTPQNVSFGDISSSNSNKFGFGGLAQQNKEPENSELMFKTKSDLSFSALASKSSGNAFAATTSGNENPFANLGAGTPVFASNRANAKANKPKDPNASTEEGEATADETYDPYYEPIIPLPEAIVVKTGEEDEIVLFNEKGKLYRHTDKEWKERGIGQIKLLHNPNNGTYRLILRRDAIHKIVLNQRITSDLEIKPHTMSSNAWIWVGMNYCDDEHKLEKLSARFKNETITQAFYDAIQKAIAEVKMAESKSIPTTVANVENVSEEEDEEDYYEGKKDEEEYDDDEDDGTTLFIRECTLSERLEDGTWSQVQDNCEVEIVYDTEIYGSRIQIYDNSCTLLSNTLIGKNTIMERKPDDQGNECQWTAFELKDEMYESRTLKISFKESVFAEECIYAYLESIGFAEQSGIIDEKPATNSEDGEETDD